MPDDSAGLRRLTKRPQYLAAARGKRVGRSAFSLQAVPVEDARPGFGITASKKVGNAPERNRIKRRLRAALRACGDAFQPQHDYVLVARRDALSQTFATLVDDLRSSAVSVHASRPKLRGNATR